MSRKINKGQILHEHCGTPTYIAPEILKEKGYEGPPVDIWSAGVVLYTMLYGIFPFHADTTKEIETLILRGKYKLPDEISEDAKDLLRRILDSNPITRINVSSIYSHPWMQNIDYSCNA